MPRLCAFAEQTTLAPRPSIAAGSRSYRADRPTDPGFAEAGWSAKQSASGATTFSSMEGRPPELSTAPALEGRAAPYTINAATMRLCGADRPASRHSIAAALRRSSGSRLSRACRGEPVEGEAAPTGQERIRRATSRPNQPVPEAGWPAASPPHGAKGAPGSTPGEGLEAGGPCFPSPRNEGPLEPLPPSPIGLRA